MLTKTVFTTLAATLLITAGAHAQSQVITSTVAEQATGTPIVPATQMAQPAQVPQTQQRPAEQPGQPVNIKVELTITDQASSGEPLHKTVSMVVADRTAGSIRTGGNQFPTTSGQQPAMINVDVTPTIVRDGAVRLMIGLEYQPRPNLDPAQPGVPPARIAQVNERLTVIVQDGKPLSISQAADAGSDRKITVELKATILK